jgi:two-component system cell cycle response regulator DivK
VKKAHLPLILCIEDNGVNPLSIRMEQHGRDTRPHCDEGVNHDMAGDVKDLHVLIVEDNVRNYALLARLLSFMGVKQTEWKRSGWHVLEYAEDTMPQVDLILLDIHLPEEDGYDVLSRLRKAEFFRNTKVVAVTADVSKANLNRAQTAGFDGFLAKPINVDLFPDQIRRILGGEPVWDLG